MAGARNLSDADNTPAVSVVIPAHNRQDEIAAAIGDVLGQSFDDFELIVVDDASTDGTVDAVSKIADPRLRVIRLDPNRGPGGARNAGAKAARGTWLAFLDSDDSWRPEKLERQLAFMRQRDLPLSIVAFDIHRPAGTADTVRLPDRLVLGLPDVIDHPGLCIGTTMMVRRDFFESIGGFDESLRRLEDWEWLLRVGRNHGLAVLNDVLADHRAPTRRAGAGEETARAADAILNRHQAPLLERDPELGRRLAFMAALHQANGYRLAGRHGATVRVLVRTAISAPMQVVGYIWRRGFG